MKKLYCIICGYYTKFKNPKISNILEKNIGFFYYLQQVKNEDEKIFKEEESIEILKFLGLVENIQLR